MDEVRKLEAKGLARAKSRSRRRRVAIIRSRTIRGSLALFAVLWGVVFAQLASGNDPALSSKHHAERSSAAANLEPTPAEPVREPAPEFEEFESTPEPEFEFEEEAVPEIEEPIVTASS
jgi:hypothetical protein